MKESILPVDNFVVINKTIINDNFRDLVVMLYQPIIGFPSVSVYFTLWSYLKKSTLMSKEYSHYNLLSNMKINIIELNEAREKLEAIGLIKTYFKHDKVNQYIYELYSPLEAVEFFNNPILSTLLYTNLGPENYNDTLSYFEMPNIPLKGYENITSRLSDVFEIGSLNGTIYDNLRKTSTGPILLTPKINIGITLELIPDEVLNKKNITASIKDLITNLSFVYDFNDEELKNIILESIDNKKNIDLNLLKENARKYYEFEHQGKLPNLIYKNQPEYLRKESTGTSKRDKMIYQFEVTSPYDFISSKYKDSKPTTADLKIIEYLLTDLKLTPAVVNVLVDYVLKINNNKLTRSYVETIAGQWKRENIKTAKEAMELAEKEHKKKAKKENPTKTIKSKVPTWVDQNINDSSSKQKELEELLKEYR
ncbi:MAG: DnaD domain protein [Bacillales bacterium]|nr:DnaD domain protein [Bacillales bacterium]